MNAFIFGLMFAALFLNFVYFPLVTLTNAVISFVTREAFNDEANKWQDYKYERWGCTKNHEGNMFGQWLRWFFLDGVGALVLCFFLAYLGAMGVLWVPVFAIAILFGLRAYIDRYGKEFKVKL